MTNHRNPAVTGFIGVIMILFATGAAFFLNDVPMYGAAPRYTAEFSEAAGLEKGSEVRVAGVRVGEVTDVRLEGDRIAVDLRVQDTWIGDRTEASIQIKTLLGQKYVALDPRGTEALNPRDRIPLERTASPYDVIPAFSDAAETLGEIDMNLAADAFDTLAEAFEDTPEHMRNAIEGVTRLSQTISSRDQEILQLLDETRQTTAIFADRNEEFARLVSNAGLLLEELNIRRQAISILLQSSQELSAELQGLVADNEQQLGPALAQLQGVTDMLVRNQEALQRGTNLLAPFYRVFADTLGTGRWFDIAIVNITPPGLPDVPGIRAPINTGGGN
ncbi:MCE family protein [Hoyosella rhizosphaerae]|uniref:ABC transporter substrate-binding protein n=1 Tax=Hoyosella rhizosphaerae TaxID=1755582 RepID=A0A916UKJ1_9ACTN|nr:MCE family protein [Hoyosella rhizosphaerae]MBN4927820.1 MCE family protein [Hoyosella rhizosphaerae]GGC76848.1 ABC transporter substrate-binding protein [Hoyosella rhizosphaerae]